MSAIAKGYANQLGGKGNGDGTVLGVDLLFHFPDYAKMFMGINGDKIEGIARARQLRLAMNTGSIVFIYSTYIYYLYIL